MEFTPGKWLSPKQTELLKDLCEKHSITPIRDLLDLAADHLALAKEKHNENSFINLAMARGIYRVLSRVHDEWETFDEPARYFFKGAVAYFIAGDDEITDFESPIGFEDDLEVLNACLKYAGRDDLVLNPEDFDDA